MAAIKQILMKVHSLVQDFLYYVDIMSSIAYMLRNT